MRSNLCRMCLSHFARAFFGRVVLALLLRVFRVANDIESLFRIVTNHVPHQMDPRAPPPMAANDPSQMANYNPLMAANYGPQTAANYDLQGTVYPNMDIPRNIPLTPQQQANVNPPPRNIAPWMRAHVEPWNVPNANPQGADNAYPQGADNYHPQPADNAYYPQMAVAANVDPQINYQMQANQARIINAVFHFGDRTTDVVQLPPAALYFADTIVAEMKTAFHLDPQSDFDFFSYVDDEGEECNVRTENELMTFVNGDLPEPVHLHLKSSHAIAEQQRQANDPLLIPEIHVTDARFVAQGMYGTIWKATRTDTGEVIVVKMVNFLTPQAVTTRELALLRKCDACPYIVNCFGAANAFNTLFIYLEYMDALSLDKYLPLSRTAHIWASYCIINGLIYMWGQDIMHRDIKPKNFLVSSNGMVKLGDFGSARIAAFDTVFSSVGTNNYLSPEECSGGQYTVAADVWSLGVSLFEMAIGKDRLFAPLPEERDPNSRIFYNASTRVLHRLRNLSIEISMYHQGVWIVLERMLQGRAESRIKVKDIPKLGYLQDLPCEASYMAEHLRRCRRAQDGQNVSPEKVPAIMQNCHI